MFVDAPVKSPLSVQSEPMAGLLSLTDNIHLLPQQRPKQWPDHHGDQDRSTNNGRAPFLLQCGIIGSCLQDEAQAVGMIIEDYNASHGFALDLRWNWSRDYREDALSPGVS